MPSPVHCVLMMTMAAAVASAQVRVPGDQLPPSPLQTLPRILDSVQSQSLDRLIELRHIEIVRLVRANRRILDMDPNGDPVVRNEALALSPTNIALNGARSLGFTVEREQVIGEMGLRLVVLKAPQGMSTKSALSTLREADPAGIYDYNHIYSGGGVISQVGKGGGAARDASPSVPPAVELAQSRLRIGMLDTGVDVTHPVFRESIIHSWGCDNRALPAAHGTAVASLLIGHSEIFNGVNPKAELYAADVYCGEAAGGAVDALVAAFGWLVQERVPVINVSLVGPKNALMERVIGSLIGGGYIIVAAVGNDGPAAPPLYPASYPGVVGVTAVDAHRHALIEAARGPQVMFAAPGADMAAAAIDRAYAAVRGTSFAAPIVAALLATGYTEPSTAHAAAAIDALAKAAVDLGSPGRDLTYGFGLVGAEYRVDPTH